MKYTSLVVSLFAVGSVLVSGCNKKAESDATAPATPNAPKKYSIAVIPKGTTHIYWQSVKAGAEAAAKEFKPAG